MGGGKRRARGDKRGARGGVARWGNRGKRGGKEREKRGKRGGKEGEKRGTTGGQENNVFNNTEPTKKPG